MAAAVEQSEQNFNGIELGFVEEPLTSTSLLPFFFPSKVGGKPSWLDLKNIPSESDLRCGSCSQTLVFLLQFYSAKDKDDCFHRTIFVFCCKEPTCHNKNSNSPFVVLRCQLPRVNTFYGYDPVKKDITDAETRSMYSSLTREGRACPICTVCGLRGPKRCSNCQASYCSRNHQLLDWKEGHKQACKTTASSSDSTMDCLEKLTSFCFPEMELVTEPEPSENDEASCDASTDQATDVDPASLSSVNIKEHTNNIEQLMAASSKIADKEFQNFKARISREPTQVLRHQVGGVPLWLSKENIPTAKSIPHCSCGSPRQFEFQILPQLLTHLHVDSFGSSIDWGTLAVYTCTADCSNGPVYHQEFLWKQDYSDLDITPAGI